MLLKEETNSKTNSKKDSDKQKKDELTKIINSNIIAFKTNDNDELKHLKESPIELTFKHLATEKTEHATPVCSFWDYNNE